MHEYVQKSTSTTLPRSESSVRGFELNQVLIPLNSGATPKSSSPSVSFALAGRPPTSPSILVAADALSSSPWSAFV